MRLQDASDARMGDLEPLRDTAAAMPRKDFPSAFISTIKAMACCLALSFESLPSS